LPGDLDWAEFQLTVYRETNAATTGKLSLDGKNQQDFARRKTTDDESGELNGSGKEFPTDMETTCW
jgi:hypothetical protein